MWTQEDFETHEEFLKINFLCEDRWYQEDGLVSYNPEQECDTIYEKYVQYLYKRIDVPYPPDVSTLDLKLRALWTTRSPLRVRLCMIKECESPRYGIILGRDTWEEIQSERGVHDLRPLRLTFSRDQRKKQPARQQEQLAQAGQSYKAYWERLAIERRAGEAMAAANAGSNTTAGGNSSNATATVGTSGVQGATNATATVGTPGAQGVNSAAGVGNAGNTIATGTTPAVQGNANSAGIGVTGGSNTSTSPLAGVGQPSNQP